MKKETVAQKTVEVKANGKNIVITNKETGAVMALKAEDGAIVRDFSGCITHHDKQYAANIAVFVTALVTKYMNKRISWADRMKKIEKAASGIDAKSIRNFSNKLRVTLNPMFIENEEEYYFAEKCAMVKA